MSKQFKASMWGIISFAVARDKLVIHDGKNEVEIPLRYVPDICERILQIAHSQEESN